MDRFQKVSSLFRGLALIGQTLTLLLLFSLQADAQDFPASPINAFLLNSLPQNYVDEELLFQRVKEGGANTVIIRPTWKNGELDHNEITHAVFLAHIAHLKIYAILPTRSNEALLQRHGEWDDLCYDPDTKSLQRTGRIDLFQGKAIDAVANSARELAAYSVDGIMFDEDYYYGTYEGMSNFAVDAFKKRYGTSFMARELFAGKSPLDNPGEISASGDNFQKWTVLKGEALITLYRTVVKAVWNENPSVIFGIPIPISGSMTKQDAYARFGFNIDQLKKLDVSLFWLPIRHRDIRRQRALSYSKTMEMVSRIVQSGVDIVGSPLKSLITIQTVDQSGKMLPLSEIEETAAMVKQAGDAGIAFLLSPEKLLSPAFTKKTFAKR